MRRRGWRFAGSVVVACLCMATSTHAAEEATAAAGRASEIFRWINFAIVAGLVIWVFARKLPPIFQRNAERISSAISKATAEKEEADRLVREAETKLRQLEQELARMLVAAQQESAAEAERIRTLAQTEAAKVTAAARAEMAAAEEAARAHLKQVAAGLAVEGAESLLVKQLTPTAQNSLVEAFAASLERRPN